MSEMNLGPTTPPENFRNWKAKDYQADPRAWEVRSVCVEALKALVAHQRGGASEREQLEGTLEHLQGRFIELGIHPELHKDKNPYYPTVSPRAMAESRAAELSRLCGVGVPSQEVFVINLENESLIADGPDGGMAVLRPTPEVAEFAASQMFLTICADQLAAGNEVFGA